MNKVFGAIVCAILALGSCTKEKSVLINNNTPPDYSKVPTILIENYVNRLYIDLLGREATNEERNAFTTDLKANNLDTTTRIKIVRMLQYDSSYRDGDSSYKHAWFQRIYDLSKARFIDGASEGEINLRIGNLRFDLIRARLDGDSVAVHSALDALARMDNVIKSKRRLRMNLINYGDMCSYMLDNSIYDLINMNSFNFVNASFDDLLARSPSSEELKKGIDIIDKNVPTAFFGTWASNKIEYCKVLTASNEFYEAQIRWMYYQLLRREAKTNEVSEIYKKYRKSKNLQDIQLPICISDEYAQFK